LEVFSSTLIFVDAAAFNMTGLLFVVLGAYVLVRVTGFPDLTVDGSFTIGAALYAAVLAGGLGTFAALTVAGGAGAASGLMTWFINCKLGVGKVISGVLSMIILILSAPYISGGSTISLLSLPTIHAAVDRIDSGISANVIGLRSYQLHILFSLVWLAGYAAVASATFWTLSLRFGLRLRYFGSARNQVLLTQRQKSFLLATGLGTGNALVAIGGAVEAQRRGGFTVNMGTGTILVALVVLVLGESIIKSFRKREYLFLPEYAVAIFIGSVVYSFGIQALLALQIAVVDLRLMTAIFLLVLLAYAGHFHSNTSRLF
jgi:putative ABC transport system permease protein